MYEEAEIIAPEYHIRDERSITTTIVNTLSRISYIYATHPAHTQPNMSVYSRTSGSEFSEGSGHTETTNRATKALLEKCVYYGAVLGSALYLIWIVWMPFLHVSCKNLLPAGCMVVVCSSANVVLYGRLYWLQTWTPLRFRTRFLSTMLQPPFTLLDQCPWFLFSASTAQ